MLDTLKIIALISAVLGLHALNDYIISSHSNTTLLVLPIIGILLLMFVGLKWFLTETEENKKIVRQ